MVGFQRARRGGFVLLAVLFVMLALFALSAPFLATARNANASSHQAADRAQLRFALDAAEAHGRHHLYRTHPSLDPTPDADDLEELSVPFDFPESFVDPHDPNGPAFDAETRDLTGLIDLGSAPPQVLANVLGRVTRLAAPLADDDDSARFGDPGLFEPGDVVVIEGELIEVGERDSDGATVLTHRGIGASVDEEGRVQSDGPLPPAAHGIGATVLDQRMVAPALRRSLVVDGEPNPIDVVEELRAAEEFSLSGGFDANELRVLRRSGYARDAAPGPPRWQRPTRLVLPVEGGEQFSIMVDDGRWFGIGSTVRVRSALGEELRVVMGRAPGGRVILDRVLEFDHREFTTSVDVLQRRAVNVNSAPVDVLAALTANLGLAGQNHRIDEREAAALAAEIRRCRPFDSFEDFVERLVLPAAGVVETTGAPSGRPIAESVLDDPRDAVALHANALNANDARLGFSTMPFAFTSQGVFELELRAAVNAPSGKQRASGVRTVVMDAAPEGAELLHVYTRQEDFDEAQRLGRRAPYWVTGPEPTARYDAGVTPPSRLVPHLGTVRGQRFLPGIDEPVLDAEGQAIPPDRVFADIGEVGFTQLEPIRVARTVDNAGRVLHFDYESRSLEGRYLAEQSVAQDPTGEIAQWADATGLAQPFSLRFWVRPESAGDGTLLSFGGDGPDSERVVLGMEADDLVLRIFDGQGDNPLSVFQEYAEARYSIARIEGDYATTAAPGFPAQTWNHIALDVRGNRPDQFDLLVDGNHVGVRKMGETRLVNPLPAGGTAITVQSTEGFPDLAVLRIGNEIIEARKTGPTTFEATHATSTTTAGSGASAGATTKAGYGGRLARVRFDTEGSTDSVPTPLWLTGIDVDHPTGTTVSHYGYSLPLTDSVPHGKARLTSDLGAFRVGRVIPDQNVTQLETISTGFGQNIVTLGRGWNASSTGILPLVSADGGTNGATNVETLRAFNPQGGYALLSAPGNLTYRGSQVIAMGNEVLGGVEIVRYSNVTTDGIAVVERGVALPGFELGGDTTFRVAKSFVFDWQVNFVRPGGTVVSGNELLGASTFCIPISIGLEDVDTATFPIPGSGLVDGSRFAQITELGEPERTEWIRYDAVDTDHGQLVRCNGSTMASVHALLHATTASADTNPPPGPGAGGGMAEAAGAGDGVEPARARGPRAALASATPPLLGSDWDPFRGEDPYANLPLTRAVASVMHFRGVLGTEAGSHGQSTFVMPVVRIRAPDGQVDLGRLGAYDPVFAVESDTNDVGLANIVHRAHYPAPNRVVHTFTSPDDGTLTPVASASRTIAQDDGNGSEFFVEGWGYVAFESDFAAPIVPLVTVVGSNPVTDPRYRARLTKFPSGELPRTAPSIVLGAGAGGSIDFGVADATIDEVEFGNPDAFQGVSGASPSNHTSGAGLVVATECAVTDQTLQVAPGTLRSNVGLFGSSVLLLASLPQEGGLLRVGEEIVAYVGVDAVTGTFLLGEGGRGVLGTQPQPHEAGECVHWLEHWRSTSLGAGVGPDDALLPLVSTTGFPTEGTVLIDGELVHYTHLFDGALAMPPTAGDDDEASGVGAFRGRFGTDAQSHAAGAPVILFPARYWDRYAPRFDGPELGYFGLEREQTGAYWTGVIWDGRESDRGGPELLVLQRVGDVPWDADPETTPGLTLLTDGATEDGTISIGRFADRAEWRVFARYATGAFDPLLGMSHGWKETPRFDQLGVTYRAQTRVLRSVDR